MKNPIKKPLFLSLVLLLASCGTTNNSKNIDSQNSNFSSQIQSNDSQGASSDTSSKEAETYQDDDVETALSKYKKAQVSEKFADFSATITTYYDENVIKAGKSYPVVVYYTKYNQKRYASETNLSIVSDYLKQYIVVYVDFNNDKNINDFNVAEAAMKIKCAVIDSNKYLNGMTSNQYLVYSLPSGYRFKKDITYFDLTKSSSTGSYDFIVDIWNQSFVKSKVGSKWVSASTIDEIPMKNGDKLMKVDENGEHPYMQYKMDIFYPSNPSVQTPVLMNGATGNYHRNTNTGTSDHADRINFTESLLKGYTMVTYDHEYVPFMLGYEGGWGHIQKDSTYGYSMMRYDGVKAETAAVRCVKYFADELGYSKENIGVFGHSKASWCSCLSVPNPESQEEDLTYSTYKKGENRDEQPYLTDKKGNKLTGDVKAVYYSMGWGSERYNLFTNPAYRPQFISCGAGDPYGHWDYFDKEVADFEASGADYIAARMSGLGHTICPHELDPDYDFYYDDLFQAFFDYHLEKKGPQFIYSNTKNGKLAESALFLQFVGNIDPSINTEVQVLDQNMNQLKGSWVKENAGNRYRFVSSDYTYNQKYTVVGLNGIKDVNGKKLENPKTFSFTYVKQEGIEITSVMTPKETKTYTSIRNAKDFFDATSWLEITGTSASPATATIDPTKKPMYCDDGSICISNGTNARYPMFYVAQNSTDSVWKHLGDNGNNFATNIGTDIYGKAYSYEIKVKANDTFQIGALVANSCGDASYTKSGIFYEISTTGTISLNVSANKDAYKSIGEYRAESNFDFTKENTIKFVVSRASKALVTIEMLINDVPVDLTGTPKNSAFSFENHTLSYNGFVSSNGMGGMMSINPTQKDGKVAISDVKVTYAE